MEIIIYHLLSKIYAGKPGSTGHVADLFCKNQQTVKSESRRLISSGHFLSWQRSIKGSISPSPSPSAVVSSSSSSSSSSASKDRHHRHLLQSWDGKRNVPDNPDNQICYKDVHWSSMMDVGKPNNLTVLWYETLWKYWKKSYHTRSQH